MEICKFILKVKIDLLMRFSVLTNTEIKNFKLKEIQNEIDQKRKIYVISSIGMGNT